MIQNQIQKQKFVDLLGSGTDAGVHSHAYIIEGAYGVGKVDFAIFCAAAILCETRPCETRPCGGCNSCKKVFSSSHPDLHFYGGEGGKPITMKEVRELIASSVLLPNDGEKKLYIIKAAQKMRPDTQNALLKIFEEPPGSVVLFLLTEKKEALLPTILSRGRLITLMGESDEAIEAHLRKKHRNASDEEIKTAVRAAESSLGQAELIMSRENRDARGKATALLELLFEGGKLDFYDRLISAKITREKLCDLLLLLQRYFADIIQYKYQSNTLMLLSAEEASRFAGRVTKKALNNMSEAVGECRKTIEQSGNINAAVSNLSIRLWTYKG